MSFPTQLPTHTCLFISSSSSSAEKFPSHICKDKFPAVLFSKLVSIQLISHSKETEGRNEPLHLGRCSLAEETLTYKLLVTLQCRPYNELKENPVFCFDCSNAVPLTNECFLRNTNWALISASAVNPTFLPLTLTVSHTRLPCLVHHLNIALYPDTFLVWLSSTCFSQLSLEFILQLWFYTPPDTTSKHSPFSLGH